MQVAISMADKKGFEMYASFIKKFDGCKLQKS